jgi:hypothetical protein
LSSTRADPVTAGTNSNSKRRKRQTKKHFGTREEWESTLQDLGIFSEFSFILFILLILSKKGNSYTFKLNSARTKTP